MRRRTRRHIFPALVLVGVALDMTACFWHHHDHHERRGDRHERKDDHQERHEDHQERKDDKQERRD